LGENARIIYEAEGGRPGGRLNKSYTEHKVVEKDCQTQQLIMQARMMLTILWAV